MAQRVVSAASLSAVADTAAVAVDQPVSAGPGLYLAGIYCPGGTRRTETAGATRQRCLVAIRRHTVGSAVRHDPAKSGAAGQ